MNMKYLTRTMSFFAIAILLFSSTLFAGEDSGGTAVVAKAKSETPKAEAKSETTKSVQADVDKAIEAKTNDKRKKIVLDAASAVASTRKGLHLLGEKKIDEAVAALKDAIGTLDLVIARKPELGFVPILVTTRVHDLMATPEAVEEVVGEAKKALDKGEVQVARRLLSQLASEIVVSTDKLPLATYPDAIKEVMPLIDAGKIDEAKQRLQEALNLVVVEKVVIPLPLVRLEALLNAAEKLSEQKDRSEGSNKRLSKLFEAANVEAQLAQSLGYLSEKDAVSIKKEIAAIKEKTAGGKSGEGFFEKIRSFFSWK